MGQASGTGEGRRLRLKNYIWTTDKCNCSLLLNCLGAGVWTPSKLLLGRFRIGTVQDWSGYAEECGGAIVGIDKTIPKFICNLRVYLSL